MTVSLSGNRKLLASVSLLLPERLSSRPTMSYGLELGCIYLEDLFGLLVCLGQQWRKRQKKFGL